MAPWLLGLLVASLPLTTLADPTPEPRKFPPGCRQTGFDFSEDQLVLTQIPEGQVQTVYLIHNRAPFEVAVRADTSSKFVPSYDKIIKPDSWITFARDLPKVVFHCRAGDTESVDCGEVLELCNYNNAKFPESNLGTYWITNSNTQDAVIHSSIKKGILLRW